MIGPLDSATLPAVWMADFLDVPEGDMFHADVQKLFERDHGRLRCRLLLPQQPGPARSDVRLSPEGSPRRLVRHQPARRRDATSTSHAPDPSPTGSSSSRRRDHRGLRRRKLLPRRPVTRAQIAVFLLKVLLGPAHVPPPATGIFEDVPVGSFAAGWIEEFVPVGSLEGAAPRRSSTARTTPTPGGRWRSSSSRRSVFPSSLPGGVPAGEAGPPRE